MKSQVANQSYWKITHIANEWDLRIFPGCEVAGTLVVVLPFESPRSRSCLSAGLGRWGTEFFLMFPSKNEEVLLCGVQVLTQPPSSKQVLAKYTPLAPSAPSRFVCALAWLFSKPASCTRTHIRYGHAAERGIGLLSQQERTEGSRE